MTGRKRRSRAGRLGFLDWLAGAPKLARVGKSLAWSGLALGITVPVIVVLPLPELVKILAVLAFACFAPGAAVTCKIRFGSATVSWALAFVLSLSIFAVPAGVMIWIRHWQPMVSFAVLDALTVLFALWGLAPQFLARTAGGRWAQTRRALEADAILTARALDAATTTQVMSPIRDEWQTTLIARVSETPERTDDPDHRGSSASSGDGGAARSATAAAAHNRSAVHVPVPRTRVQDPADGTAGVRAVGDSDQTAVIRMPEADETAVLRLRADGDLAAEPQARGADETAVIRLPELDETAVLRLPADGDLAAEPQARGADETAVIHLPGLRDVDSARRLPVVGDETHLLPVVRDLSETALRTLDDIAQLRDEHIKIDDTGDIHRVRTWGIPDGVYRALHRPGVLVSGQTSVLAAAVALWILSLRWTDVTTIGEFGLLSVMHPAFVVALAVCIFGFLAEIARGARRSWLLVAHLIVLVLILHATVPILIQAPEYAWTYKHVGVIDLFQKTGHIVDSTDIYQAWPMFFAAVAQLASISGGSALRISAWGPVFFDAANCLPLYAIIRSLTADRRLPYLTVFVFTCINWVAQDYLSPQAFVYVLCLGAILVMVRWLRRPAGAVNIRPRIVARLWQRSQDGLAALPYAGKRAEWIALGSLYLIDAVVAMSHQLSPYFVAMSAIALVVLGFVRTWQIAPILVVLPMLYLLPNYRVADSYGIFDGIDIFKNLFKSTQGVSPTTMASSHGQIISAAAVQLFTFVLWGIAVISVIVARRRLATVALPAVLLVAPFPMLLAQSYGGEVIYRVFLFSAPWTAYLICRLGLRLARLPAIAGVLVGTIAIWVCALGGIQGEHGQLSFDRFTMNEVRATQWVYDNAPKGALIVAPGGNLPGRLNERYVEVSAGSGPIDMIDTLQQTPTVTPDELENVTNDCYEFGRPVYLVITQSMINYDHYFGYLPDGKLENLRAALATSPFWTPVFVRPDAVVFQLDTSSR